VLTLSSVSLADAGDYSVGVSNNFAETNSLAAHLTVLPIPDLSPGLVLHLPFDDDYLDYSGRGNSATNVNSTAFVAGKIGSGALYFWTQMDPGSSNFNYATLGLRPDLQFSSNVNFSVTYWILYPTGVVQSCDLPVFGNAINSTLNRGYVFAQGSPRCGSGGWSWTINDGRVNVTGNGAPGSVIDGNWHHLAFTFDRTANAISYLDGVQVDVQTISNVGDLDTGHATVIGQDPTGTYAYDGSAFLDGLGVWRRVLSAEEVRAIYLLGVGKGLSFAAAPVTIVIQKGGGQTRLVWSQGTLQSAGAVTGPFNDVTNATSPS
jgi:hypothetical protein